MNENKCSFLFPAISSSQRRLRPFDSIFYLSNTLEIRSKQELESKAREGRLVGDPKLTETIKMFR